MSAGDVDVMRGDMQMYSEILGPCGRRLSWLHVPPGLQSLSCSCSGKHLFSNLISFSLVYDKEIADNFCLAFFPGQKAVHPSAPCF